MALLLQGKINSRPGSVTRMSGVSGTAPAARGVTHPERESPRTNEFANPSSKEDPIEQIIRYVNDIREGRYQTPKGRPIRVTEDTPFYGYVVCDPSPKVRDWLFKVKNYTPLPDGLGWFNFHPNIRLYVEVLSWDKLHKDATMRNQVFFRKLGV